MPKYVPITKELCLVEQKIKTKKVVTKKGPVNYIWIYDRSGSMTWALPELTQQLISLSKTLPKDSYLSLGWFSGEGDFNWVFKGFRISDNSDYKILEKAIKDNSSSRNTTCFSEILQDVSVVIKDLSVISKTFSLHFFTDGYPVVSNYSKEVKNIFSAIKDIKGKIHAAMLIGFGSYYNRQLMAEMSEKLGAMLIHSSLIPEYSKTMMKLIELSDKSEPKEEIEPIVKNPLALFTVTDQGVVLYSPDEDGKIYINPQKDKETLIYYISNEEPNKKSWDKTEINSINFGDTLDTLGNALYGASLILSQQTKTDIALEIIGKIGDKSIVDGLSNAFQVEEYGQVEEKINSAVLDVGFRFSTGRDSNYLPPSDAFCVFDVLNILVDDDKAAFYPYHEKTHYERIGVATKSKEGYSKFNPDKDSQCPFNTLTWHESRLNLSVQTRVEGTIELKDVNGVKPKKLGLAETYPTFVFRNFSFIKDGHVHFKTFYMTSSEETYKVFKNKGLIFDDSFKVDGIYAIDISKLPAINRKIAEGKTSATDLCVAALSEQKLKAQIKSLKYLREGVTEEYAQGFPQFNDRQVEFLRENGVIVDRGGMYAPPTEKEDPVDFYMAKTFDIKLSGIASLPTVKKVMEKIASGKSRTPVESLIEEGISMWNSVKASVKDPKEWFDRVISEKQKELKIVRTLIQETKMSVILGKKWFEEFSSRENCELVVNGIRCVFELSEERVPV